MDKRKETTEARESLLRELERQTTPTAAPYLLARIERLIEAKIAEAQPR